MRSDTDFADIELALGGRYQIVRALGRGAFGAVYLARDVQLHRLVAVKVLHSERMSNVDERARLLREARTVGQLSHPGIVPLLTFGETANAVYMVMPYVDGESLASVLRREERLDPLEVRRILIEIADAVAYAHGQGVLHRDIKPENILLEAPSPGDDAPPRVRLIDFGVAAFPTRDAGVRASEETWGTPHFMAPEQAFGEPELDPRSELYALGALGFLMLGGRLPFEATSVTERLAQQRKGPVVPLRVCAPNAPKDLAAAIERCLAFQPEDRWARARDLRSALIRGLDESQAGASVSLVRQRLRGRTAMPRAARRPVFFSSDTVATLSFDGVLADARFAARTLRKMPGFTAAVVFTLAVGLAATTMVFSMLDALVLRLPPVADPRSLVVVEERSDAGHSMQMGATAFSYERYLAYNMALGSVFTGLSAQEIQDFSVRSGNDVRSVGGVVTAGNYFEVLGVRPALGVFYTGAQDRIGGATPVAVIGYEYWQQQMHGDKRVLGRTLVLDSRPMTIIGVAPRGFHGAFAGIYALNVWVPAAVYRQPPAVRAGALGNHFSVVVFGRLRPGLTIGAASAALRVAATHIPMENESWHVLNAWAEPLHLLSSDSWSVTAGFMKMLFAISGIVLLIAATNSASMLLARATVRRREIATRLAIGATRARVARQLAVESLLLCTIAGVVSLALTALSTRLLNAIPSPLPWAIDAGFSVDARVFGIAAIAVLGAGVLTGLAPAFQATKVDLASAMKATSQVAPGRARARSAFVVAQIALSVTLLAVAGLFVRSLDRLTAIDPGFDVNGVAAAAISLRPHGYDEAQSRTLVNRLIERLAARPEVAEVSVASSPPLSGNTWTERANVPGHREDGKIDTQLTPAAPGLLELLRVPMVAGRTFTVSDGPDAPRVAVINEMLATRLWRDVPPTKALGRMFEIDAQPYAVIGVVRNGRYAFLQEEPRPFAYLAFAQNFGMSPALFLRARGTPALALRAARQELAALDPNIALERQEPLTAWVSKYIVGQRIGALLIGVFGLVGLLLAATGIYGLLAFDVAQRSREFGVRMALGADAADVVRLVLRGTAALVGTGLLIGLGGALAVGRLIDSFLVGLKSTDPVTLIVVPVILAAVALLASLVPVRRATAVDPMNSLRAE